jgi:hypothetical protein
MRIRDQGKRNSDPGSGISIPDPQHWCFGSALVAIRIRTQGANRIRVHPDPYQPLPSNRGFNFNIAAFSSFGT